MTSEGLGEMFEGDSADKCAGKFPLVSMGGPAEGLACADPGVVFCPLVDFVEVVLGFKICLHPQSFFVKEPNFVSISFEIHSQPLGNFV